MDDPATILEALRTRNAKEAARIRRWREGKRQTGKLALTIWLPEPVKLHVEDTALKRHSSPSALILEALTTPYHLSVDVTATATDMATDTVTDTVTDTSQLRMLLREELRQELRAFFSESQHPQQVSSTPPVTVTYTDTRTITATDTTAQTSAVTGGAPDRPRVTDTVTNTSTVRPFNTSKYHLGRMCPGGHAYEGTGQTLLNAKGQCGVCEKERSARRRATKRQALSPA